MKHLLLLTLLSAATYQTFAQDTTYLSGKLQMTGAYADDSMHVSQGQFTWYDDGMITHRCDYVQSK